MRLEGNLNRLSNMEAALKEGRIMKYKMMKIVYSFTSVIKTDLMVAAEKYLNHQYRNNGK